MWGRETEEWPLQLCGQIPQSTNLQKEKSCVKLIMYNFLSIWAAFPRSLPEQILSQLTCSLWPVPTAHCTSVQGPCGELALRCYQQALSQPAVLVCQMSFLHFWDHRENLGMIQFRAQCGVFSPTEICLLWGLLHWSQGRKVCMTLVIYLKTPVSFSQEKINQNHKKEGKRCHFPPSEENAVLCELL